MAGYRAWTREQADLHGVGIAIEDEVKAAEAVAQRGIGRCQLGSDLYVSTHRVIRRWSSKLAHLHQRAKSAQPQNLSIGSARSLI